MGSDPAARVRDASLGDLPRIVELLAQLSLADPAELPGVPLLPEYEAAFRDVDGDSRQRLLLLEVAGEVVGALAIVVVPNVAHQGRPYGLIENVVVDESVRGRGYGEMLMREAIETARRAGCYKVSLFSNKRRLDAHRFYEGLGFDARHEGFRLDL
jgi:GNAT superfamily N-acetyltransferase